MAISDRFPIFPLSDVSRGYRLPSAGDWCLFLVGSAFAVSTFFFGISIPSFYEKFFPVGCYSTFLNFWHLGNIGIHPHPKF